MSLWCSEVGDTGAMKKDVDEYFFDIYRVLEREMVCTLENVDDGSRQATNLAEQILIPTIMTTKREHPQIIV